MITQALLDYIRTKQAAGKSMEEIKQQLKASGWQEADITEGLAAVQSGQTSAPSAPTTEALPKAGEILKEAWATYKSQFWKYVGIAAIPSGGGFVIGFILGLMGIMNEKGQFTTSEIPFGTGGIIGAVVLGLAFIYLAIWATVALLVAARDRSQNIAVKEALTRAKPYLLPFFTTSLLVGLGVLGGFILLIVPGIIFALWWSQTSYVVLSENLTNTAAMKQSKSYVKGRMGTLLGKLFYIGVITWVIAIIAGIIFGMAGSKTGADIANALVNIFWTPVITLYGFILYEHLKRTAGK